jgi:hypothetical protein
VTSRAIVVSVLAALGGVGCGKGARDQAPATVDRSLTAIEGQIFAKSCAYSSCHSGAQPAAHLDLSAGRSCAALVGQPSCLFPSRLLVSPGAPADSFLLAKLTGAGAGAPPDNACVGMSNARMPFGAQPLTGDELQQISDWIAAGADCNAGTGPGRDGGAADVGSGDGGPADGGAPDADGGGVGASPPAIAALSPPSAGVSVGQRVSLTVTLSAPAGAGGVTLAIAADDPTVVATPASLFVAAGATQATFDVMGRRPGAASVRARLAGGGGTAGVDGGGAAAVATIDVGGLYLAEIFLGPKMGQSDAQWIKLVNASAAPIDLGGYRLAAGVGSYGTVDVALGGVLAPGACFVVGGPRSGDDNGAPAFDLAADFMPDLPAVSTGSGQATSFALFDAATPPGPGAVPVDAVAAGARNSAGVLGPGGAPLVPAVPGVADDQSLARTGPAAWTVGAPTPSACPSF